MWSEQQHLSVQMTHLFPGTCERVFQAWTRREELEKWFGPEGYMTTVQQLDVQVGGQYRFQMRNPDGGVAYLTGRYEEIVPNEKLVYTWRWEDWAQNVEDTLVTVEFIDKDDATEIVVTHQNLASEAAVKGQTFGWKGILEGSLRKYLA